MKCEIGRDDKESCNWNSKPKIQRRETKWAWIEPYNSRLFQETVRDSNLNSLSTDNACFSEVFLPLSILFIYGSFV